MAAYGSPKKANPKKKKKKEDPGITAWKKQQQQKRKPGEERARAAPEGRTVMDKASAQASEELSKLDVMKARQKKYGINRRFGS